MNQKPAPTEGKDSEQTASLATLDDAACSPSSFPWVKNGSGWILGGGKIIATLGGCTKEDDCNARVIEAAGDMIELTRRIANGGMSYPTYDRKIAEAILRKIFPENDPVVAPPPQMPDSK